MAIIRILIMSITLPRLHVASRIRNWSQSPSPPCACSITYSLSVPSETPSSPAPLALVALSRWLHLFLTITIFTLFCYRHQVCSGFLFKAPSRLCVFPTAAFNNSDCYHYHLHTALLKKKKVIFFIMNVITAVTIIIYLLHDSISEPSDKRSRL